MSDAPESTVTRALRLAIATLRRYPALLAPVIVAIDLLSRQAPWASHDGWADAVNHLLTALIWLLAARSLGLGVHIVPGLIAAATVGIDTLPAILGRTSPLDSGTERAIHIGWIVLLLLLGSVLAHRRGAGWMAWTGISVALASRLARDFGTGLELGWWPPQDVPADARYATYLVFTMALAALPSSAMLNPRNPAPRPRQGPVTTPSSGRPPGEPFVAPIDRHDDF